MLNHRKTQILYINACVRKQSRTALLADYLITKLNGESKTVNIKELALQPLDETMLTFRSKLIAQGNFNDKMFDLAKDFAAADIIVMAAPYWDLSFPTWLKLYIEHININNIVFKFSPQGEVIPLCKAEKLYYITTKGGYNDDNFGFEYIKSLAQNFYGIKDIRLIKAEGLDIAETDVAAKITQAQKDIDDLLDN